MQHKQQKHVFLHCGIVATGSIALSFLLWTSVVTTLYVQRFTPVSKSVSVIPLHAAGVNLQTQQLTIHANVQAQVTEQEVSKHAAAPKHPHSQAQKEMDQWELQSAYTLSIPSLHIHTPVYMPSRTFWNDQKWDMLEEQMQTGLRSGAVAYPHSVRPGSTGTTIVAGHSSPPTTEANAFGNGHLFAQLPSISVGETVSVLSNGEYADYIVRNTEVVSPSQTSILQQQSTESVLKLITCYPVGTTQQRFVVTAVKQ